MTDNLPAIRQADPIALGQIMFASKMFPDTKSAVQAVVKILAGGEYGLGPVAAMSGIHIIDNKPVPGAHVLAGRVKRSGRYDFRVKAHDNTRCVLEFFDRTAPAMGQHPELGESSFTMDDAKRAGLAGRKNWQNYPRNMLFARALANGVRWYCPDVTQTGQVLVAEEAADAAGVDYAPEGAVAEPLPVQNQAADTITVAHVAEISALYRRTDWKKADAEDPHAELRMQLLAAGVDGNLKGDVQEIIARLTLKQYEALRATMAEAAGPDDGEPVEVIGS